MQAEGGLMSITGAADGPPFRLGVAIADITTGLFAAQGILAALLARAKTGKGQHVDVGMLDAVAALLTYQAGIHFTTGATPSRIGNRHPTIVPYETFAAADGDVVIAVGNDDQFRRMCAALGRADLAEDPRFRTNAARVEQYSALKPLLDRILAGWTRDELVATLVAAGVPCGRVRTVTETLADPQLAARDMIATLPHLTAGDVRVLGTPVKLSATPGEMRTAPPVLGQHTDAILANDVGLTIEEIRALRAEGVV
jgi:crotonobetainyl-CoA:carnitine CoA-transferase CaiB-like acyl-CoA transferase